MIIPEEIRAAAREYVAGLERAAQEWVEQEDRRIDEARQAKNKRQREEARAKEGQQVSGEPERIVNFRMLVKAGAQQQYQKDIEFLALLSPNEAQAAARKIFKELSYDSFSRRYTREVAKENFERFWQLAFPEADVLGNLTPIGVNTQNSDTPDAA